LPNSARCSSIAFCARRRDSLSATAGTARNRRSPVRPTSLSRFAHVLVMLLARGCSAGTQEKRR
jgi:hypothetical protein